MSAPISFTGVVAMDPHRGIGLHGGLPWRLKEDLALFRRLTMGHTILMGRRTWESLPRPLPGRQNVVLTRNPHYRAEGALVLHSLDELANHPLMSREVMVIGGARLYTELLPQMQCLCVSEVHASYPADTYFPEFRHIFPVRREQERFPDFTFATYHQA